MANYVFPFFHPLVLSIFIYRLLFLSISIFYLSLHLDLLSSFSLFFLSLLKNQFSLRIRYTHTHIHTMTLTHMYATLVTLTSLMCKSSSNQNLTFSLLVHFKILPLLIFWKRLDSLSHSFSLSPSLHLPLFYTNATENIRFTHTRTT